MTEATGHSPEAMAAATLAVLPHAVWSFDAARRLVLANPAARQAAGLGPEAAGASFAEVVHRLAGRGLLGPGDPALLAEEQLHLGRGDALRRLLAQPAGDWAELHSLPIAGGGFAWLLQPALRPEALPDRILETMQSGVVLLDAADRVVRHNPAAEVLAGLPPGVLRPGLPLDAALEALREAGEYDDAALAAVRAARGARSADAAVTSFRLRPDGGTLRCRSTPMPDGFRLLELSDVTDTAQAAAEAQRRADLLDGVLGALPHGVLVLDAANRVTMINAAYQAIMAGAEVALGETREEITRRRAAQGEYGAAEVTERALRHIDLPAGQLAPVDRVRPDGTVLALRYAALPDGGSVVVTTDITALHRARQQADAGAAQLRLMLEHMRHGIALYDAENRLVMANELAHRLTGLPPGVLRPGRHLRELVTEQLARGMFGTGAEAAAAVEEVLGLDRSRPTRSTRTQADGSVIEIQTGPTPEGGFVITYSDVTARTQAEAAVRAQAALLQATLDSLRNGVMLFGQDHRLRLHNALAAELAGHAPGVLRPGVSVAELIDDLVAIGEMRQSPELVEAAPAYRVIDRGRPLRHIRPKPDGRIIEVRSDPMPDGGFLVTHADVTPLARAEAEARQRAAMLQVMQDCIRHGLAMYGPDRRLIAANRLAATHASLLPEDLQPGLTFDALVERQRERGAFGAGMAAAREVDRIRGLDRSMPHRYQRVLGDGRVIEVSSDPTPGGGFVITWSDITARAQAEAAAGQRAAMLQAALEAMRHGCMIFDAEARLLAANALAAHCSGLLPDHLVPGSRSDALLALQRAQGSLGEGAEADATLALLVARDRRRLLSDRQIMPDGRIIEVISAPTAEGGFVVTFTDITALARAEATANERAAILQGMLDNLRHGIVVFGPDGTLAAANQLCRELAGLPPGEIRPGRSFASVVHEVGSRLGWSEARLAAVLARDRSVPYRSTRITADGRRLEIFCDPIASGGFIVSYVDSTPLARAEAEAQARAALLQTMQDTMRHGIALFDARGRVITANQLAATLAGVPPEALAPGSTHAALTAAQLAAGIFGQGPDAAAEAARLTATDRRQRLQHQRRLPDGRVIDSASDPIPDGGFVITWSDVSALAQAERAAEQRAGTLQGMIENMRHGVALFGPDRRLLAVNRLLAELGSFPPGSLVPGRSYEELVAVQQAACATGDPALDAELARQALAADRSQPTRSTRQGRDGRILEVTSNPMPDGGFVIGVTDITALARAEAEAKRQAEVQAVMLDTIRHGITFYGPDHRLISVNRLSYAISGVPIETMQPGMTLEEVLRAQQASGALGDAAQAAEFIALALAIDRSRPYRYQRRTPDGRLVEVVSDPTPDGGFAITYSDITALAEAEAVAASRAAMLQDALDNMRHGFVLYGPDRCIRAANALAVLYGGLRHEDVRVGLQFDAAMRQQHARGDLGPEPAASELLADQLGRDRARAFRTTRVLADGRITEISSDPTPEGGFIITYSDITALARAEAAAQERATMLKVALDSFRHGMALYGPDRRLRIANRLATLAYGLPDLEHRAGEMFDDLVVEQLTLGLFGDGPGAARTAAEVIGFDRSRPLRYQRRLPSGRVLDISSEPTPDGGFVITHSDVTELAEAKAEASARAATLQVMLDNIRHGISYFGADHRLIAHNPLAEEFMGAGPMRAGMTLAELGRLQQVTGAFGADAHGDRIESLGLDRSRPARYVRRTRAGRMLEVSSTPTPDGGFVVTHSDVTELMEAQNAAADRAATLQVMLESMRHGIALYDRDRRLVSANRLASELNAVPPEAFLPGRTTWEVAAYYLAVGTLTPEEAELTAGDDYSQPRQRLRRLPDGRLVEIFIDPTQDGGFVATYTDITALTRAEAAAQQRAAVLQVMLDNMRHGICYYGPDRRVITANALAADLGGHPPGSLVPGRALDELIDEQLALGALGEGGRAVAEQARATDRSRPTRYVRPNADGRSVEVTSDPTPDGGFVVTMTDITPLVDAERAAKQRAGMLEGMLDNIRHGIALFDQDGRVLAANPVFRAMLDLPAEVLAPGRPMADFVNLMLEHGEYGEGEAGLAAAQAMLGRDRTQPLRTTRTRPNGMTVETVSDPIPGGGWVITYTDVTEDRRIRAELERAKNAAESANLAKSRFLATMSHELRTPLNAVIGFSEAFLAAPDPERGQDYVRSIHEAGRHLLSLIDDILDVTRAETSGFAITTGEIDLIGLGETSMRVMRATASAAGVVLRSALPQALPRVRADELRMRQVLLNLLSNAVKFTPAGGTVTLAAEQEATGDLVMRVSDTGIGIRAEDIPRAFEPFTQLDSSLARRFPGSGLGLYLSKALAEAQGATLSLESTEGQGSVAVLRIPRALLLTPIAA